MAIWIRSEKACRIAKCAKSTLRRYDRMGEIESKRDPDNTRRKLYKRSDVKDIDLKGRTKTVTDMMDKSASEKDEEEWLTVKEAAELKGKNKGVIYDWIERGWIDSKKDGRILVKKEHIELMSDGYNEMSAEEIKEQREENEKDDRLLVDDDHCKNCVYAVKASKNKITCPFSRCIKHNNWSAEEKEYEVIR